MKATKAKAKKLLQRKFSSAIPQEEALEEEGVREDRSAEDAVLSEEDHPIVEAAVQS